MLKKVESYVKKWQMIEKGDKVIIGVSGGADSVCLLFMLMELQKIIQFDIVVVHVNHRLRGEDADADEAYVKQLCEKFHLNFVSYSEDVELVAKNRKQSTEEAGREVRREAFYRTMHACGGTKIALAHHKNDNAETCLMNLARGTGIKGLSGMLPIKDHIIRPFLCVERIEIEQYLRNHHIAYRTDSTNQTDEYTRNRVRNHIIPYLEREVNAGAISHISEAMEYFREIQSFLEQEREKYWTTCVQQKEERYTVLKEQYCIVPRVIQSMILKEILTRIAEKEKDISGTHVKALQDLMENQVGRRIDLPYEIEAQRTYQGIELQQRTEFDIEKNQDLTLSLKMNCEGSCDWGTKKVRYRVLERSAMPEEKMEKRYTKWFDYDIIKETIHIRTRNSGDYITIHSSGGTQKLKEYFINEKIPSKERDKLMLVAEGHHILWIPGYRVNPAYQISEHTKQILEIQIDEGENHGRQN